MTNHPNHHAQQTAHKIAYLDDPARTKVIDPAALFQQLPLTNKDIVLDFGAGTGFFTIPAAQAGAKKVYALDRDQAMLHLLAEKASHAKLGNIECMQSTNGKITLTDQSMTVIIASLVLHELPNLIEVLAEYKRILKPGGHLICLEFEHQPAEAGGQQHPRIGSAELSRRLQTASFSIEQHKSLPEGLYQLIAKSNS